MAHGLECIDWHSPWLQPVCLVGKRAAQQIAQGSTCAAALNAQRLQAHAAPCKEFVPQSALPRGVAYEQFIHDQGRVPTRDGLHDFFNGLCWIQFPKTKKRLNVLQAAQIAQAGIRPERGPARDALTVFDENAAFLQAPDALWQALVAKDWLQLFITLRPQWQQARLVLFGHALMEKLVSPRKSMTAHVYRTFAATHSIADLDDWVARDLDAGKLAAKPFAHLPVLGVPGWWAPNTDPGFYTDASVFRPPGRHPRAAKPVLSPGP